MRKKAWIVVVALWMVSALSTTDVFASKGKEAPPACPAKFDDSLETDDVVVDFKGVRPPKPIIQPIAEFSDKARREGRKHHIYQFISVVSMVVGVDGVPRDVCLVKAAGYDLDAKAAEAAWQYRFKPAMYDGRPVAARVTMEVNFRLQ